MKEYIIEGTVKLYVCLPVEAESEDEAVEKFKKEYVNGLDVDTDGIEFNLYVNENK